MTKKSIIKHSLILIVLAAIITFIFSLPDQLFNDPTSTVIEDKDNNLLAAQIASDGQWRFPETDTVPQKFEECIICFEDQYFYKHPGINPLSIIRAIIQNIKAGEIVSGGSTLTSQVIRLSQKDKKRSLWRKIVEFTLATRLEIKYSKQKILSLYSSYAPFGGNVVGLEAASWRYYGRSPQKLSWGESATLAVLPNAPSLIFPGKNQKQLLAKRNRLLNKLLQKEIIDSLTCELAQAEPLPGSPRPLPQIAPHLLTRVINDGKQGIRIKSTIDKNIQSYANRIINKHYNVLSQNDINNGAALIIDVKTGNTLAYVGNTSTKKTASGKYVDIIQSPRSTGSTLKPFLYALMQKEGTILPHTLVPDIPTHIAGYAPKNFDKKYNGAVFASKALARSLNIPAVRMLRDYGLELFTEQLKKFKLNTINKPANHYGLSIILGGAEVTLWELTGVYSSMARVLNNYTKYNSLYNPDDYHSLNYAYKNNPDKHDNLQENDILGASAIWLTFEALSEMERPIEGSSWRLFDSSRKIAWKTGTSFGFRDAWAIGVTPEYVVAVWIGNADGEGRPGLTGTQVAAPVMFDLFKQLPKTSWFTPPYDDMQPVVVCTKSGYKASSFCTETDAIYVSKKGILTKLCPYHKNIHLDKMEQYRVTSECYRIDQIKTKSWFVLPPVMEWYYKSTDPFYKTLPPVHPDCRSAETNYMDIIYPKPSTKLFIPKGFNNKQQRTVFEVAHRLPETTIYWHLDDEYIGKTTAEHKMEIYSNVGFHNLTLVDNYGETDNVFFEVLNR